jgi:hypothetical protein
VFFCVVVLLLCDASWHHHCLIAAAIFLMQKLKSSYTAAHPTAGEGAGVGTGEGAGEGPGAGKGGVGSPVSEYVCAVKGGRPEEQGSSHKTEPPFSDNCLLVVDVASKEDDQKFTVGCEMTIPVQEDCILVVI